MREGDVPEAKGDRRPPNCHLLLPQGNQKVHPEADASTSNVFRTTMEIEPTKNGPLKFEVDQQVLEKIDALLDEAQHPKVEFNPDQSLMLIAAYELAQSRLFAARVEILNILDPYGYNDSP